MARGDWNTSGITNLKNRSGAKVGFEWRYANTEEEAVSTNSDLIQVIPFIYRTNTTTTAYQSTVVTSYLKYKYGSYDSGNKNMGTAYNYEYCSSTNTRYYAARRSLSQGHPLRSASGGTAIQKSGTEYYGFEFTIPHKTDGTQDALTITWFFNGADSHGDATATAKITLDPILRTPTVNVTSVNANSSSVTFNVESGNGIQLDGVRVTWTDANGNTYTNEFSGGDISSVTVPVSGELDPKTEYTFTLTGYNAENDAWSTTATTQTVTTAPKPIQVRSINYSYPASSNSDSLSTWTAEILANLRFGDGNSLSDLNYLEYVVRTLNGDIVSQQYRYQSNYSTPITVSGLQPSTTYIVMATAYTQGISTGLGMGVNMVTPLKSKRIWIKNSQGEWLQGVAYIKTENGWKQAANVYYKTSDGWQGSVNE